MWLLHNGLTRENTAKIVGISQATIRRYVAAFREGGLEGLRWWDPNHPVSDVVGSHELIHVFTYHLRKTCPYNSRGL